MSRRSNLILVVFALLLALLSTFVILKQLSSWKNQHTGERKVSVVTVVKAVAAHQLVDSSDVAMHTVPASAVEPGAQSSLEQVVGHYAATGWFPGQQVIAQMLVANSQRAAFPLTVPTGLRAFTIADDSVTGVDHLISAGDFVDVLVTYSDKKDGGPIAATLLQDIKVLNVDQSPAANPNVATVNSTNAQSSVNTSVDTVTLAVTPKQAEALDYAIAFGRVHLALRSPHDSVVTSETPVTPGADALSVK
ncbi:Flp pilus assembly protein CpaB [Alicyclobacillus tolerans]|uniref:Flp pilus assembly protein CpaB n=1 Tax=Alicyclobacillus tolerans TaxID=90970 RepID=UPI001F2B50B2|nr:Flp pilus assembly protein CpaB [Alicyclobacillus tolerans]MCF8563834.1 Flp pilus assembly protein CpaB [Alicyclobacillus tolerans]